MYKHRKVSKSDDANKRKISHEWTWNFVSGKLLPEKCTEMPGTDVQHVFRRGCFFPKLFWSRNTTIYEWEGIFVLRKIFSFQRHSILLSNAIQSINFCYIITFETSAAHNVSHHRNSQSFSMKLCRKIAHKHIDNWTVSVQLTRNESLNESAGLAMYMVSNHLNLRQMNKHIHSYSSGHISTRHCSLAWPNLIIQFSICTFHQVHFVRINYIDSCHAAIQLVCRRQK